MALKDVADYWNEEPCNTSRGMPYKVGSKEFFEQVEKVRYELEPIIPKFCNFDMWEGKKVLEVGCGLGTELCNFAKAGADVTGIDLSRSSVDMTNRRLKVFKLKGKAIQMNAQEMSFDYDTFDLVYSWGVIHHAPIPLKVVDEIYRVLKPGGTFKGMVYHRFSTMGFAIWLRDFLKHKNPLVSLTTAFDRSMESPGTKAYGFSEVKELFGALSDLRITCDFSPEYMKLKDTPLKHILKIYPKGLASWLCVEGYKRWRR